MDPSVPRRGDRVPAELPRLAPRGRPRVPARNRSKGAALAARLQPDVSRESLVQTGTMEAGFENCTTNNSREQSTRAEGPKPTSRSRLGRASAVRFETRSRLGRASAFRFETGGEVQAGNGFPGRRSHTPVTACRWAAARPAAAGRGAAHFIYSGDTPAGTAHVATRLISASLSG